MVQPLSLVSCRAISRTASRITLIFSPAITVVRSRSNLLHSSSLRLWVRIRQCRASKPPSPISCTSQPDYRPRVRCGNHHPLVAQSHGKALLSKRARCNPHVSGMNCRHLLGRADDSEGQMTWRKCAGYRTALAGGEDLGVRMRCSGGAFNLIGTN
jgi:hypothetical protein